MKDYLNGVLANGEKVLWEGQPESFKLLEGPYKKSILTRWIVLGVAYIAIIGGYLEKALSRGDSLTSVLMLVVVLSIFAVLIVVSPVSESKMLLSGTKYVITDKRAIVINKDGVKSIPLDKQTRCKVTHLENHKDVISFGEACETKESSMRSVAVKAIPPGKNENITGLIFYSINDAKDICMKNTPCYMV